MARFRFHIPWGLLFAAFAFAAMGAAAALTLLTDFHGHLLVRVLLAAAGAALLGGAGWTFSERLANAVNLHTSPFLRLALPGVPAVYLATEAAGAFSELGVGAGALWPEVLCPLLYLAVGLPPLLGGTALIAGIETVLAARRGGGGVGESLRPIARYLLLGAALCGATIYASLWLPHEVISWVVAAAPNRVRESGWLQQEKRLFLDVHKNWSCDVLVVPFAGTAPSVDRAARSLMMRYVSAELALRTGLCVADPTLVARALGARARSVEPREVRKLADAMHAGWIVYGSVMPEAGRQAFNLTLRVDRRNAPSAPWGTGQDLVWGPVEFSDELPPEAAFARIVHTAAEQLGIPMQEAEAPEPAALSSSPSALPSSPDALVVEAQAPLARARGLQLLAATYHPSDIGGEHLWERSLVALAALPAGDETARTLRARAALHLYRRPYALQLLQGLQLAEARALQALAQGNLSDAERLASDVTDALAALTLQLELESLRERYGRNAGQQERRRALLDTHPGYAALLYVPLSPTESFQPAAHELIRKALAENGVEVSGMFVRLLTARIQLQSRLAADGPATAAAIEHSYAPLWRRQGHAWRTERAFDRVATWDEYDALYAANRAALVKGARAALSNPSDAAALPRLADALTTAYAGFPALQASVAAALADPKSATLSGSQTAAPDALTQERARRFPGDVLAWEGGETDVERELRAKVPKSLPASDADEPPRPWRNAGEAQAGGSQPASAQRAALEHEARHYMRMQKYAWESFGTLERAIALQESIGSHEQAARLAQDATIRFVGDPARERYLMRRAEDNGDIPAYVALLHQKIREQPDQWSVYLRLASAYLRLHQPALAQQALLAFPAFQPGQSDEGAASGAVSVPAAEAGMLLLSAGEAELARPLFALAAKHDPESMGGVSSRSSLAQIDGNWREARARAVELHERFQAERGAGAGGLVVIRAGRARDRVARILRSGEALRGPRPVGSGARWPTPGGRQARRVDRVRQALEESVGRSRCRDPLEVLFPDQHPHGGPSRER